MRDGFARVTIFLLNENNFFLNFFHVRKEKHLDLILMCSTCRYNLKGVSESPLKHLDGIPIRKALSFFLHRRNIKFILCI